MASRAESEVRSQTSEVTSQKSSRTQRTRVRAAFSWCVRSPRLTWKDTSSKSVRPAKGFESCETVSIAESAQCPLVRCPAQPLVACLPRRNELKAGRVCDKGGRINSQLCRFILQPSLPRGEHGG